MPCGWRCCWVFWLSGGRRCCASPCPSRTWCCLKRRSPFIRGQKLRQPRPWQRYSLPGFRLLPNPQPPPPTEGILLEEALDIARNYLLTTESIPQETLDTWHPQALFTVEDKWYIMFHTDETLKDPELPCYTVRVDNHNGSIELISDFNTNG